MRFFHKLSQFYLVHHFSSVVDAAKKRDEQVFGVFKWFAINVDLSTDKQRIGNEAIQSLHQMSDVQIRREIEQKGFRGEQDDYVSRRLDDVIKDYDRKVDQVIKKHRSSNKGQSVLAITEARELVRKITEFTKEEDVNLWGKEYDETDPLDVFRFYIAQYICSHINTTDTFAEQKVKLARNALKQANSTYSAMSGASKTKRIEYILSQVEAIENGNQALCGTNPNGFDLPFNVMFMPFHLSTKVNPRLGLLGQLMQSAKEKITALQLGGEHAQQFADINFADRGMTGGQPIQLFDFSPAPALEHTHQPNPTEVVAGGDGKFDICSAIMSENVEQLNMFFKCGVYPGQKVAQQDITYAELAVNFHKPQALKAMAERYGKMDPTIEAAFNLACSKGMWECAQAIDKERALAKQVDSLYKHQLSIFSCSNTLIKEKLIGSAEDVIRKHGETIDKSRFYECMSKTDTAKYRQVYKWSNVQTNTSRFFSNKKLNHEGMTAGMTNPMFSLK